MNVHEPFIIPILQTEFNIDNKVIEMGVRKTINQYYKKIIKPTDEQIKLHREYLKTNLKKNFFN